MTPVRVPPAALVLAAAIFTCGPASAANDSPATTALPAVPAHAASTAAQPATASDTAPGGDVQASRSARRWDVRVRLDDGRYRGFHQAGGDDPTRDDIGRATSTRERVYAENNRIRAEIARAGATSIRDDGASGGTNHRQRETAAALFPGCATTPRTRIHPTARLTMEQKSNTSATSAAAANASSANASGAKHVLPPLPYDYAALEPHIDARTMQIHHDKHHQTYVDKLNEALAPHGDLARRSVPWLMTHLDRVPDGIRTAVRNNGGGHLNHSLFWRFMAPNGGGQPGGGLAKAIAQSFGGFEQFTKQFDEAGAKVFGSGWVFLAMTPGKAGGASTLEIVTTPGHDNPIQQGKYPLLLNDVWEHAYYLKHQNRRPEYLKGWWAVVNWREVERRFDNPGQPTESEPEGAFPA